MILSESFFLIVKVESKAIQMAPRRSSVSGAGKKRVRVPKKMPEWLLMFVTYILGDGTEQEQRVRALAIENYDKFVAEFALEPKPKEKPTTEQLKKKANSMSKSLGKINNALVEAGEPVLNIKVNDMLLGPEVDPEDSYCIQNALPKAEGPIGEGSASGSGRHPNRKSLKLISKCSQEVLKSLPTNNKKVIFDSIQEVRRITKDLLGADDADTTSLSNAGA